MEIRDDVRHGYEKKLRKEPTCVFSDVIKIYKKMKVLVATEKPFAKVAVDGIREVVEKNGYELALLEKYTDVNDLYKAVADADALIVRSDKVTKEVIDHAKQLKIVVRAGAGYDNLDLEACTARGIVAMNTPGQNSNAVAELVMGMLVYAVRNFYNGKSGSELMGKKLGILAFGNVGRNVARIANGFGMKVYAFDAFLNAEQINSSGIATAVASQEALFDAPHPRHRRDQAEHQLRPRGQDAQGRHPCQQRP